jgi:N6-L-threonylcarbamoyladenine synthase
MAFMRPRVIPGARLFPVPPNRPGLIARLALSQRSASGYTDSSPFVGPKLLMSDCMRVLGIETTCDETAAGVVEAGAGNRVLSNEVLSQIAAHAAYGGVVPEIAARAHVDALDRIVARALEKAGVTLREIDGVAAAAGPGLVGGVMVGLTAGKALALAAGKPFIAVNHLEAHALTARLTDDVTFPYLLLLVSGGHTQLIVARGVADYVRLGTTIDDAVGEAFDKVAKMLSLPYPGGPAVEREALKGDPEAFDFPRPMSGRPEPNFSLSGLKTAVRLQAERLVPLSDQAVSDLCASFQAAVVDVLVERTRAGIRAFRAAHGKPTCLVVAGGVAANDAIRRGLTRLATESGLKLVAPPLALCGDNGAMIAWAGLERLRLGLTDGLDAPPRPRWPLEQRPAAPVPAPEPDGLGKPAGVL